MPYYNYHFMKISIFAGTYPLKPKLPAVGGNEGVGRVIKRGNNVTMFQEGDWVIPCNAGIGT